MKKIYAFLKNHKNKITLYSIFFLLLLSVIYFIWSIDTVALKGLVFLLCALTYVGVFFGVRFAIFIQNKLGSIPLKAKKVLSAIVIVFAFAQILICTFEFAVTLGSFSLVICSCFSAMFCAFIYLL